MKTTSNKYMAEMTMKEMVNVNGGEKKEYLSLSWSGTDNELVYAAEALCNGVKILANGCIWIYNQFQ